MPKGHSTFKNRPARAEICDVIFLCLENSTYFWKEKLTWYAAQKKAFFVLTITWKRISEVWAKLSLQNLNWGFYRPLATWWRMDCFMWALVKEMRPLQYWLRKGYQYSCKSPPRFQLFCKIYSCPCVIMNTYVRSVPCLKMENQLL